MNINDKSAKRTCTSCQMCAAVCPKNAIKVVLDDNGFYRPSIDDVRCVDCGICTKVCYKFDTQIEAFEKDKLAGTKLYGAYAKDRNIVANTTSGGLADVLACQLIREGYKCVGVVYDSEHDVAIDKIVASEDELKEFRGSKYIQSYTLTAFKEIVKNSKNEKYAVFGTPCHIYALDKYLRQHKVRERHMLIDLYCHGCPSMNVWKKYIQGIKEKIAQGRIDNANFRSKIRGWGNFYVVVLVDGKPVYYSNNKDNEFFDLFFSDQVLNEACNDCLLRSTLAYTDIRLGDFWGKQYVLNNTGVSAISLVTDRSKELFKEISSSISYKEERYEDFLPWQSWGKCHHPNPQLKAELLSQLQDGTISLRESVNTIYRHQSLRSKFVRYGKNFVHAMPSHIEKYIRWLFYKVH